MVRVSWRHAVRHPLIGLVGSGLVKPGACGKTYQSGCGSAPNRSLARFRNSRIAAQAVDIQRNDPLPRIRLGRVAPHRNCALDEVHSMPAQPANLTSPHGRVEGKQRSEPSILPFRLGGGQLKAAGASHRALERVLRYRARGEEEYRQRSSASASSALTHTATLLSHG
jgi:hypothetical protein